MRTALRRAWAAVAIGATGLAMATVVASPASAATFVTPRYGMTCQTGVGGGLGGYTGYATCYTPVLAKWRVHVNCTAGGNYTSIIVYTSAADGWYRLGPSPTCFWGVNAVSVVELI